MIYLTGDTHGECGRLFMSSFARNKSLTKDDYVIVLGDFGCLWDGSEQENDYLDELDRLPFTILFIEGNHENFDLLNTRFVHKWKGGKVHFIRQNVIHLMRGQVFEIDGHTFFTMGGAQSHDIEDGIIRPTCKNFDAVVKRMLREQKRFRIEHISWWSEELPSQSEYEQADAALKRHDGKVDYVLTHCAPNKIVDIIGRGMYQHDELTNYLEDVRKKTTFKRWYFGHYHDDRMFGEKFTMLYRMIIPLDE